MLIKDEDRVLRFLQAHPGVKFTAEEVGRGVRPEVRLEGRLHRNWASLRLNSLHRQGLIHKEGRKGRGLTMKWWVG